MTFIRRAVRGRVDGIAALDERIEVDHVEMVLEEGDGLGAADVRRER